VTLESHHQGIQCEEMAQNYLEKKGLSCLARRVRTPYGEIDLLMSWKDTLIVVEVKYRKNHVEYALSDAQKARLIRAGLFSLQKYSLTHLRFDVICMSPASEGTFKIRHFAHAWDLDVLKEDEGL